MKSKTQPKNVGINPISYGEKDRARREALEVLALAKSQNRPVKFLKKQ